MGFPVSPDGMYHYHVGYQVTGETDGAWTIGFTFCVAESPILAMSDDVIDDIRTNITKDTFGISASQIIITSLSVLAAPE